MSDTLHLENDRTPTAAQLYYNTKLYYNAEAEVFRDIVPHSAAMRGDARQSVSFPARRKPALQRA